MTVPSARLLLQLKPQHQAYWEPLHFYYTRPILRRLELARTEDNSLETKEKTSKRAAQLR